MIYLDASAIITLIAGRRHAPELRDLLAARPTMPMGTSTLGFVETVRTLDQIGDYPSVMADLVAGFTEILVTEEVRDAAARLPKGFVRSTLSTSPARRSSTTRSRCWSPMTSGCTTWLSSLACRWPRQVPTRTAEPGWVATAVP